MSERSNPAPGSPGAVAVVGGGISGLTAAYELTRAGVACTIIDPSPALGGVIRTERAGGCLVEAGPDSFLAQKPWAMELIRELGLEDQVIGSNDEQRRTYVLRKGRLVPLPEGIQFMAPTRIWPVVRSPLLSVAAKLRMGAEMMRRPKAAQADRSVADFVKDHYGAEVNEYLAQPMLAGVYGGEPEGLSVNAVLPRFVELETRYGSLSRGLVAAMKKAPKGQKPPLFRALRNGMQTLTDALAEQIAGKAQRVQGKAGKVMRSERAWRVQLEDGALEADCVLLAVPAYEAARLLESVDGEIADSLCAIPYGSSITAGLVYERPGFDDPLEGFGFLVPRAEGRLIAACTWVETKFADRVPKNRALLRAFMSGEAAKRRLGQAADSTAKEVDAELKSLMGFRAEPREWRVAAWDRAMAQYPVGHKQIVERARARAENLESLYLIGNAYEGIGIPDCIRLARETVRRITQSGD